LEQVAKSQFPRKAVVFNRTQIRSIFVCPFEDSGVADMNAGADALMPAWRQRQMPDLQSFLRKGVSLGYVGLNLNLKGLKANAARVGRLSVQPRFVRVPAALPSEEATT
jgi:hypothetical protein